MACKIFTFAGQEWTYSRLGGALSLSAGEAHNAVERGKVSGLVTMSRRTPAVSKKKIFDLIDRVGALNLLCRARRHVPRRAHICVGQALAGKFEFAKSDVSLVWPHPSGTVRGEGLGAHPIPRCPGPCSTIACCTRSWPWWMW